MTAYRGIVIEGSKRATTLGFPTVNIPLSDESVSGIYAARVSVDGNAGDAVVYADQKRKLLEAHIFDFSGDLYGKEVTIELLSKIREDETFTDDASLEKAVAEDIAKTRAYFKKQA